MTVAGAINPSDYYFVVINNADDSSGSSGPVPVIASPWGNGFVAGAATHFVEYNGSLPGDGYAVYSFISGTNLQQYSALSAPVQDTAVSTGSNTLEFRIPLSELATSSVPTKSINYLQINFITTNLLPVNSQENTLPSPKLFDALGDIQANQLNQYITIGTAQNGTYSTSTLGSSEQLGQVVQTQGGGVLTVSSASDAPNLDIVNWSVQISG
jgi:hypothetical protein